MSSGRGPLLLSMIGSCVLVPIDIWIVMLYGVPSIKREYEYVN